MAASTTEQAACQAMLDHYPGCPTCTATDDEGKSRNTRCETGDRLHQEYRQACRTARSKETR